MREFKLIVEQMFEKYENFLSQHGCASLSLCKRSFSLLLQQIPKEMYEKKITSSVKENKIWILFENALLSRHL